MSLVRQRRWKIPSSGAKTEPLFLASVTGIKSTLHANAQKRLSLIIRTILLFLTEILNAPS